MGVIVPVKVKGAPHSVIVLAATQMPTRESLLQFERVFNEFAKPMKVEASLNMHANGVQDDLMFLETLRKNPNGPNPYLYGPERFSRWMDIMIECGRGRLAALGVGDELILSFTLLGSPFSVRVHVRFGPAEAGHYVSAWSRGALEQANSEREL